MTSRARVILYGILVLLLFFMPYSTWALQWLRFALHVPVVGEKILIGWKEVLLFVMVILMVWTTIKERRLPFKVTLLDKYLAGFALLGTVVGYLMTRHLSWTIFGFRYDFSPFIYYFAARSVIMNREEILTLMRRLIWFSIPCLLFGLAQTLFLPANFMTRFGYSWAGTGVTGNPLPPYHYVTASLLIIRAMSTFPGPNSLALYAVIILLMVVTVGCSVLSRPWRWGVGILSVATLLASFSRGYVIGLIAALLVGYIFWKLRSYRRYATGVAVILLLAFTLVATMVAGQYQSNGTTGKVLDLVLHDSSTTIHENVGLQAWDIIKTHPFGTGLGTSGLATTNTGVTVENPESWYIQMTVEFGWIGLLAALALLVLIFRQLTDMGDDLSDTDDRRMLYFFVIGFAAIAVGSNFLPSWFEVGSLMWWILFGFFVTDYAGSFPRAKALS